MHPSLEHAIQIGSPLIEGTTVIYLWHGSKPPLLINDQYNWEENPIQLHQISENIWIHQETMRTDAYLEYSFLDPDRGERIPDPLNPNLISNGLGEINNYFYMPDSSPHPLTIRDPKVPRGKITKHVVNTGPYAGGNQRQIFLYHPQTREPVPLLIVYDGNDYIQRGRLPIIVDNLIFQNRIQPIAMAMVSNRQSSRMMEYGCSDVTLGFLTECVFPLVYEHLNLIDLAHFPGGFGIMGASMGGMMALYTGLRMPEIFGNVLAQSGAYAIDIHEFVIYELVRHLPLPSINLWMDVGVYEFLLETNRSIHSLFMDRGFEHGYYEYPGGHNYTSWRNDLWQGLEYLFGVKA